jgi:MFS family permease
MISWLVIDTTGSPALLGLTVAARFAPMTFGVFLGTLVDRINRQRLLVAIQVVYLATNFSIGMIVMFGQLQFWQIMLASLIYGAGGAIGMPVRSVLTVDVVGRSALSNATALTSIAMTSMGFVGPALVAMLVNIVGIGPFYFFMAALYFLGAITIHLIRVSETRGSKSQSAWKNLIEGLRYHKSRRDITSLQLIALIANIFSLPMVPDLLVPIVAKDILDVGASGYGWLSAAMSLGRLFGSILLLILSRYRRKGLLVTMNSLLWGPALWLFATSTQYGVSLVVMFAFGAIIMITMNLIQVLLLTNSPPEMRGRVMGVRMQVVMCEFIMNLVWGPALGFISAPLAGQINSVMFTLSMIGIMLWAPSLRKMTSES